MSDLGSVLGPFLPIDLSASKLIFDHQREIDDIKMHRTTFSVQHHSRKVIALATLSLSPKARLSCECLARRGSSHLRNALRRFLRFGGLVQLLLIGPELFVVQLNLLLCGSQSFRFIA